LLISIFFGQTIFQERRMLWKDWVEQFSDVCLLRGLPDGELAGFSKLNVELIMAANDAIKSLRSLLKIYEIIEK
jgi:hypothetical protein